jgi:hypothetical protein
MAEYEMNCNARIAARIQLNESSSCAEKSSVTEEQRRGAGAFVVSVTCDEF